MQRWLRSCFFILLFLVYASFAFADHSEAYLMASKAYNSGDYQKAYQLWLGEAEAGVPEAQEMLGAMSAAGKGVVKNDREAVRWYRLAAEQGVTNAQYTLGKMYLQGQGIATSPEHACAWWLVASANGNVAARRERKAVHEQMTPEQIEKTYAIVIEILLKLGG